MPSFEESAPRGALIVYAASTLSSPTYGESSSSTGATSTTRNCRVPAAQMVSPTLITPRDFDLSPYFEIVKFDVLGGSKFDYRKLLWVEETKTDTPELEKSA